MYQATHRELIGHRLTRTPEAFVPRPRPYEPAPTPEGIVPRPRPFTGWAGRWTPATYAKVQTLGTLGELPQDAPAGSDWAPTPTPFTRNDNPTPSNNAAPSAWDNFFSGIAKVATPAAQALLGIKATGMIQQQQQKTLAATWNPALTNPALQAQAYQNAFMNGSGSLPISGTTLAMLGAGALALFLIARK